MGRDLGAEAEVDVFDAEALLTPCLRCWNEDVDNARAWPATPCVGEATAEATDMLGVRECELARKFVPRFDSDKPPGYDDSSDMWLLSRAFI